MIEAALAPSPEKRRAATAAVILALIVAALEGTVVTTAMPTIAKELGGLAWYPWVFASYLVASAVSVLVCGKLADAIGRRPVFAFGTLGFVLGSILAGSSPSITFLVAARAIQGLGAGAIQPVAMTITTDLYDLEERARIQGVLTGAWGAANVAGPLVGAAIVSHASWRWVFVAHVPFALLAVFVMSSAYRDPPRPRPEHVGARGAILAGLAASALLLALDPKLGARAAFAITAGALTLLLAIDQARSPAPLLAKAVVTKRVVVAGLASSVLAGGLLHASVAYVPLWTASRPSASVWLDGVPLVLLLGGWALGSSGGVRVLVRFGMRASTGGGYAIAALGALGLALAARADSGLVGPFAATFVLGFGLGPAASTSLVAPQNAAPWQHRGAVTSSIYAARTLGGAIAVAVLGARSIDVAFVGVAVIALAALLVSLVLAPGRPPERG